MRKTAMVCLLLMLLLLPSCKKDVSNEPDSSDVPVSIVGTFALSINGFDCTAELNAGFGNMQVAFCEPESLKGYVVTCNDSEFVFDMCGVTSVRQAQNAPENSIPSMLYPVVRSALSGSGKFRMNGNNREYETAEAILSFDENGNVIAFADHSGKIKADRI